jgi:hypothetical protein
MCVLCWQFITAEHWTEQRFDDRDATATVTAGGEPERARRRAWQHRTQVLNQILGCYGLHLDTWQSRHYLLSDRKGSTLIVQDLGALWPAAQQLVGRVLDPLDAQLLEALERACKAHASTS